MQRSLRCLGVLLALAAGGGTVSAQGLVWTLPDAEGRWVRYEGTVTQVMKRPNDPTGDLSLNWTRHLTITALGVEAAQIGGQNVDCRWIELKSITGPVKEGIIDAGPGGVRLYKVLVPLEALKRVTLSESGTVFNADGILAAHFPIVKGFRKIGNESAAPIATSALEFYPALSLLQNYRDLSSLGSEEVTVAKQSLSANHFKAELVTEDPFTRSTNVAELWRTDAPQLPFGLAKWLVTLSVEGKDSTDSRSQFKLLSTATEEMAAAEIGDGGQSELIVE